MVRAGEAHYSSDYERLFYPSNNLYFLVGPISFQKQGKGSPILACKLCSAKTAVSLCHQRKNNQGL